MKLVACSFALASVGSINYAAAVEEAMTWSWELAPAPATGSVVTR